MNTTNWSSIRFEVGMIFEPSPDDVRRVAPSGVAAGDYDGDGDTDLFIVRGDIGPNLLYRNDGNMKFVDVADSAGVAFTLSPTENLRHGGPMFADMDGDGDLDLFVGGLGNDPSRLFENNGDGTFTNITAGSGIDTIFKAHTVSAAFGDYDRDGDLDLVAAHWGSLSNYDDPGDTGHLWRNDTDANGIRFQSVSEASELSPTILNLPDPLATLDPIYDYTFAPGFYRINDDLYPDLLMAADFNRSQYFTNDQDGTFTNATDVDVLIDGNGMGSAVGDYDNDGDLDWFVTSIECDAQSSCQADTLSRIGNRLYRNENGVFEDVTDAAGVRSGGWGWGACFLDFDNDGDLDIYHTNGWPRSDNFNDWTVDKSRLFVSDGAGGFTEQAADFGLDDTDEGRGVVCTDLDGDGDIDILQLHRTSPGGATLWRNDNDQNNYLQVKLLGAPPNTEAAGARITVDIGGTTQMREVSIASNYVSQNPTVQHFGLGGAMQVDQLTVEWPDGQTTVMNNVQAGQLVEIAQQ
ncbi:MAG: CRTAC1 family protein [Woeseiaceae bacterium]|nr:CRTAC1 family protein [Woeseiaceae bacterium]NIP22057.1 CRTAC1 family protein [Woeseiaceae bacterium]NIS91171.1 CRTAC1 family protein [Woeseiaceae bacterium]